MLVILAGRGDDRAAMLAARWREHGAALLTPDDLSASGWCHDVARRARGRAVVDGRVVAEGEIGGVVTRLDRVDAQHLPSVAAPDRSYAAAEMTALLASWLASLTCPVVNRATPSCLAGPSWRTERWVHLAARLGIPAAAVRREVREGGGAAVSVPPSPGATVAVVGERAVGDVDARLASHAVRLAKAAGVALLAVHFSGPEPGADLVGADLWPDVARADVAEALLEHLRGRSRCSSSCGA